MKLFVLFSIVAVSLAAASAALAQPQIPATFWGSASIEGEPVPDGTEIRGYIDGKDCTQLGEDYSGTITDGGVSVYAIMVMHETQEPGCGLEGKTITFTIGGEPAEQVATWKLGVERLDLNAGTGQPMPVPTPTPIPSQGGNLTPGSGTNPPTAVGEATPVQTGQGSTPPLLTGTPPTDDVQLPGTTPRPPSGDERALEDGDDGDGSLWLMIAGAVLVLAAVGGGAGYWLSTRKRNEA